MKRLTERQRECLEAVCRHGVNKAARELFIEPKSVRGVLERTYRALDVRSVGQACYLLGQVRGYEKGGAS